MASAISLLYGLKNVTSGAGHAVVVLHGIRQTRDDVIPLARQISEHAPGLNVFVYGYNHTRGLEENGRKLASTIAKMPQERVDLVGYSMGGLVARLAATEPASSRVHTVVTLATPNRGSMSNAELTALGQLGRSAFEWLSPLAPRTEGVKDLTRTASIMSERRSALLEAERDLKIDAHSRRYASIPGLFYNIDSTEFSWGPSAGMTGIATLISLINLRIRLTSMTRSHDGIVTERSNNIALMDSHDWSEVHLVADGERGEPARCHAVTDTCRNHDHSSIINDSAVAHLIAALLMSSDWRTLRKQNPYLGKRVRLYPFDSN